MKFKLIFYFLLLVSTSITAQLVLGNGAKIKLDGGTAANPVFLVLTPPASNPIITNNSADGIILEDEYNRLQYNLGTAITPITVPYMTAFLEQIPLTVIINTVGVGSGNIRFSGKAAFTRATGWDNTLYTPSDVINMGALGVSNNSGKTIDRFWIIDANNYTTKPAVTLEISYLDAEWAANGGNSIMEPNLAAQRFNTIINDWDFYNFTPAGSTNTTTNKVLNINVPAADFYRSWTLNDKTIVLPIELLNFTATCIDNDIVLEWCTASEKNNDYFTIEQSVNGADFAPIGKLYGNGTSGIKHCYKFTTSSISDMNYFRLTQTDFDGKKESLKIISLASCNQSNDNILITNDGSKSIGVIISSLTDQQLEFQVHNTLGQIVAVNNLEAHKGNNTLFVDLNNVSIGIYFFSVFNGSEKIASKKILVTDIIK